jgi:hypothetical protein
LARGFVVLFDLLVVNQWHVMTEGFVLALGSRWVRLYFVAFHLTTVIVVLNIFTAFVLEVSMRRVKTKIPLFQFRKSEFFPLTIVIVVLNIFTAFVLEVMNNMGSLKPYC